MKRLFLVAAFIGVTAYAQAPQTPLTVEDTQTLTATVDAVDQATRSVTLRGPKGNSETLQVSDEVKNFAQIKVGDKVVVRYYQGLAAELKKKGEGTSIGRAQQAVVGGTAPVGSKPAAAVGNVVTTTVVIQAVDRTANTLTFDGVNGSRTIAVKKPEAQKFIAGLKKGDEVDITYTEALAVSVEPTR
jgi:hypothetical protein